MNPEEPGWRKPLSQSESSDRFPAKFEMYRQDGRRCLGTVFAKGKHTEARQNQFALWQNKVATPLCTSHSETSFLENKKGAVNEPAPYFC